MVGLAMVVSAVVVGCGEERREPSVLQVPGDHATIQRAVEVAEPGDLVLVAAGTYAESVVVASPGITIRGTDRNAVVLDGGHELAAGFVVVVDGVAIENLTVRNFVADGVLFDGTAGGREPDADGLFGTEGSALVGFRVSYVTAANNGADGIRVLAARDGLVEHSYASGHPTAGVAVEQCAACNIVVTDTVAELNGIGYSGANASGSVYVVGGVFRGNRLGMAVSSQEGMQLAPQSDGVLAGNSVIDNGNPAAPVSSLGLTGGGIALSGATGNTLLRNRITGNGLFGVGLLVLGQYLPATNRIEANAFDGNGVDLYYELPAGGVGTYDNCFVENAFATSLPTDIETVLPCDAPAGPVVPGALTPTEPPVDVDHREIPAPPAQPTMPGDVAVPPASPAGRPDLPDLDSVTLPTE